MDGRQPQPGTKAPAEGDPAGLYWLPLTEAVKALLGAERFAGESVILFGEIFGAGVQDLHYGLHNNRKEFLPRWKPFRFEQYRFERHQQLSRPMIVGFELYFG